VPVSVTVIFITVPVVSIVQLHFGRASFIGLETRNVVLLVLLLLLLLLEGFVLVFVAI
jgi:hypothetical protein